MWKYFLKISDTNTNRKKVWLSFFSYSS